MALNKPALMTIADERIGLWDRGIVRDRSTEKITGKVRPAFQRKIKILSSGGLTNPQARGPLFPGPRANHLFNSGGFHRQCRRREHTQDATRVARSWGCKPKPAEFVQLVKIGGYSHSIPAKMASKSIRCRLSRNA